MYISLNSSLTKSQLSRFSCLELAVSCVCAGTSALPQKPRLRMQRGPSSSQRPMLAVKNQIIRNITQFDFVVYILNVYAVHSTFLVPKQIYF